MLPSLPRLSTFSRGQAKRYGPGRAVADMFSQGNR